MNLLLYNYVYTHRLADFVMLRFLSEPMMVDGEAEDDRTVMAAARARRVRRQQRIQAALDRMAAAKDVKSSLKGDCALHTVYVLCVCVCGGPSSASPSPLHVHTCCMLAALYTSPERKVTRIGCTHTDLCRLLKPLNWQA